MTAESPASGPAGSSRSDDLLGAVFAACAARPGAPALTGPSGATLTYGVLRQRIASTAAGLSRAGLEVGDRVLFSVRPTPAGLVLALGIVAAGGTVVFADPGAGPELFATRLAVSRPRWAAAESILYAAGCRGLRSIARRRGLLLPDYRALAVRNIYSGRWLPGVPRGALAARTLAAGPARAGIDDAPEREALVVFTSGTTDAPRAVVHTRGSLGASLRALAGVCALGPGDRVHTDQLMLGLPALAAGAHWTMPPFGFAPGADPKRYARGLAGATHTFVSPADLAALLDAGLPFPSGLRCLLLGGAPVVAPLLDRARKALPRTEIRALYGMTEILPVASVAAQEKLAFAGPGDLVGTPLPGVSLRLADDGELLVSGPHLCRGHLGEPPLTEMATGDLARIENGRIVLAGRKKEMLIRGHMNIYPGLYEPSIARLPGVDAAVMLGIPDAVADDRVVLVVSPSAVDGPPRVLPGHGLAREVAVALPSLIDAAAQPDNIVVVSRIPTSGRTGKPDRAALLTLIGLSRCGG